MSDLACPHCRGTVPRGASVCRGCQAEVEYGAPTFAILFVAIVSAVLGVKTSGAVPESLSFLSWVVGVGCFVAGSLLLRKIFKDRVNFKRIYRT
ncbi:MAG: hypothetical protein Q8K42_06610, partial [Methylobacter sp.]|nr:hypothetical protein [Methylobacter sp.]